MATLSQDRVNPNNLPSIRIFSGPGFACQVLLSDSYVEINNGTAFPTAVTLPDVGGGPYTIVDGLAGAGAYPIVVQTSSGLVIGAITQNAGSLSVAWDGAQWVTVGGSFGGAATLANIAALRLNRPSPLLGAVFVQGYYTSGDGGGGFFFYSAADALSIDNGGTIIADASGRRWRREIGGGGVSVKWFGAKGTGAVDDSGAFQATIDYCVATRHAVYVPTATSYYLLNFPLNCANVEQLVMYGDGSYPITARITPSGGSVLAGNAGLGKCVIDATGANGFFMRDFTIATIGMAAPTQYGVITGTSTVNAHGGSDNHLEGVSFLMAATGVSCAIYGVNANLLTLIKVNVFSDYSLYLSDTNSLGVTPPFAAYTGVSIQSDGNYSAGCVFGAYGSVPPLVLVNANNATHDQLYIVNINGGPGFAGQPYAMEINNCSDITMKVEIDYFASAVHMLGAWQDINLDGAIFQGTTPINPGQPLVAGLNGTSIRGGRFNIRPLVAAANALYGTQSVGPTLNAILGTSFMFDTAIATLTGYFNMTAVNAVPLFNLRFDGNTDSLGNVYQIAGGAMAAGAYRIWVNGIRTGTA